MHVLRAPPAGDVRPGGRRRRLRVSGRAGWSLGMMLVLAGYGIALCKDAALPPVPPRNASRPAWLTAHTG